MTIAAHTSRLTAIATALVFAAAASAGSMDDASTQGGSTTPSGTWRESLVNELDELLLQFNNDITYDITAELDPVEVLDYVPRQDHYTVGEIMFGTNDDNRLIYDRLAVRAVVYVLGYRPGELPLDGASPVMLLTEDRQLLSADGALNLPGGAAGSSGAAQPQPQLAMMPDVPEPTTAVLLAVGGLMLLRRDRRSVA